MVGGWVCVCVCVCIYIYMYIINYGNWLTRSVTRWCPTLCDPMDCSTPDLPVHHQLSELAQIHVHRVSDAIQPSHPLSSPSPAFDLSQHQGLFQWVSSLHQVAKVLGWEILWSTPCKQETRDSCWCDLFSVPKPENLESWWCDSQFKQWVRTKGWMSPSSAFCPIQTLSGLIVWAHLHQGGWPALLSSYRVQGFKC